MRTLSLTLGIIVCLATAALAQDAPARWAELHGFASIGTSFNFNHPSTRSNQLRVFDFDDRRVKLDVGELVLQRPAARPSQFGFRADVAIGGSVPRISAASGLFRDPETGEATPGSFDIQQLYVSYVAPLGSGIHVDAGKFTTH